MSENENITSDSPGLPSTDPSMAPTEPPSDASPAPAESSVAAPKTGSKLSPELEREIDEAMKAMGGMGDDASSQPAHKAAIRGPRVIEAGREHRTGAVVSVGPKDLFVEFSPKELGVAPRAQWKEDELPKVGDDLELIVDRFDSNEQLYMCSRPGAVQKADWELLQPGQVIEARVVEANKGGLKLDIAHHDAFMPASLVDTHHIENLSIFVGEKVRCKVERIDRQGRGRIILNRRSVVAEEREEQLKELKTKLEVGQNIEGVVRKIMPFGAFVDLGGIDGLVHISDLRHTRVEKVEDVVKEGDQITVQILKLDWGNKRLSLGLKQTQPDPYTAAAEQFPPETVTTGKVTRTTAFGAFVELAPGVEGLVHISELEWQRIRKVEDAVRTGQAVKVKVLSFDPEKQRISLSVKQTTRAPASSRGKGEEARSEEEIRKETPAQRRMRERATQKAKQSDASSGLRGGGFGEGLGLGDLKL